jgi:hypothetical protein
MKKSSQQGISLITVFFIMTIILSVVLSLSLTLLNELKNINSSENSLTAFYLADSGVEKLLYFNRKKIPAVPPGISNGICSADNVCSNCQNFERTGEDCDFCKSCEISYTTKLDKDNSYETMARIAPNGDFFNIDISVKGLYKNTSRAIALKIANKDLSSSAPVIENVLAVRDLGLITISADVTDPDGVDQSTVKAHIRNSADLNDPDIDTVMLNNEYPGDTFSNTWTPPDDRYYYVYVRACDASEPFENCGESIRVPVTNQ